MSKTTVEKLVEIPTIHTFEECDGAILKMADCTQEITKAEAEMNERIQIIRDEYDRKTNITRTMLEGLKAELERFSIANKDAFEKTRTKDMIHGSFGFRSTPPKTALLNRKYKWETVLELLKRFPWAADFIRKKEEVDKEAILASYSSKEVDDQKLAAVGLKIDQDEKFFIEIRWEEITEAK
jgi:phage host-nuclease inhibitor protein Gam